jgi:hypothetical protein
MREMSKRWLVIWLALGLGLVFCGAALAGPAGPAGSGPAAVKAPAKVKNTQICFRRCVPIHRWVRRRQRCRPRQRFCYYRNAYCFCRIIPRRRCIVRHRRYRKASARCFGHGFRRQCRYRRRICSCRWR